MANLDQETPVAIVMVPLPAQGHLNQLLHLSRLVSAYNLPVHFVGSTTHIRQAKLRVHGWNPTSSTTFHFHELPTPAFTNPLPDPNAATKFPSQIIPSMRASTHLRQPVHDLIQKLSSTVGRVVVIYDSMMAYVVQDVCDISNVESYCFQSISAFSLYSFYWEGYGKPYLPKEAEIVEQVPSAEGCFSPEFEDLSKLQIEAQKPKSGDLYNTSRVIEGLYVDLLAKGKITGTGLNWAIGPFNPVTTLSEKRGTCMDWLDKQGLNSVIFISFGSTSSLSDEQFYELAHGLERSEQKFVWVVRDADKGDVFEGGVRRPPLPEGFEERVEGRGVILREWAPQLEILSHSSIGGFLTHCGWNSCMESISMGVPIVAWPMHSDQPRNAVLMTKVLRIGVEIKEWDRREEVVSSEIVEKGVKRLMASEEGDEMRKRAGELGHAVKNSKEMESFITHITR
ncbi:hypothetical protein ACS0TY_025426 [Phlomoides rotata]